MCAFCSHSQAKCLLTFRLSLYHLSLPVATHYIDSAMLQSSPTHYLDVIQACMQIYCTVYQKALADIDDDSQIAQVILLMMNMMRWTQGLGAKLTHRVEEMIVLMDIFKIDILRPKVAALAVPPPNWGEAPPNDNGGRIYSLEAIPSSAIVNKYSSTNH